MDLNKLAAALTAHDGLNIDGPYPFTWCGSTTFEIHVTDRLGNGREVTVRSDGTASWMPGSAPRRVKHVNLPSDPTKAAKTVASIVYGA